MADIEYFKKIINEMKTKHGIRQLDIANKIEVSPTYLSDMLNGRVPVTDNIIEKIHETFPFTRNIISDKEIEEIKAKFEEIKTKLEEKEKRVKELEYTIELQKKLLDQK